MPVSILVKLSTTQSDNTVFGKHFCNFYLQSRELIKVIPGADQHLLWFRQSFTDLAEPLHSATLTHAFGWMYCFNPKEAELWTFCMSGIISKRIALWVHKCVLNSLVQIGSSSTHLWTVNPCSLTIFSQSLNLLVNNPPTLPDFCVCVFTHSISPRQYSIGCTTGKQYLWTFQCNRWVQQRVLAAI